MDATQPAQPGPPPPPPTASHRPRNGLGVAALVIGVASLVAGISFVLFPLALVGGLVGLILGIIALTRGKNRGATNTGQARGPLATQACSPGSTSASPRPPTGPMSPPASPASLTTSGPREREQQRGSVGWCARHGSVGTPGCRQGLPEDRYPVRRLAMAGPAHHRSGLRSDRHKAAHHARLRRRDRLVLRAAARRLRRARAGSALLARLAVHPARGRSVRGSGRLLSAGVSGPPGVVHTLRSRHAEVVHLDAQPAAKE
jgi:hypothetical protein